MPEVGEYFQNGGQTTTNVVGEGNPVWETSYSNIIALYIPYFNRLPAELKKRFLERTYYFKNHKNFHYVGMNEQAEIPILISAAAAQLTLGLEKFELSYFKDIY